MATKSKSTRNGKKKSPKRRYIGKPTGIIQQRVQEATPQRFGIVSVDCAKRRSKWLLCDYFGRVIIEPTKVEHNAGCLAAMTQQVQDACEAEGIIDCIAAIEMTGIYHKPVVAAFQKAGVETRIVHPFASSHYRKPLLSPFSPFSPPHQSGVRDSFESFHCANVVLLAEECQGNRFLEL